MDALVGASGRTYTLLPIDSNRGFPQSFPILFEGRSYQLRLYVNVPADLLHDQRMALASAVNTGDASITVTSTVGFPTRAPFRVRIDREVLVITAMTGSVWTVTRGADSTTPAAHISGTLAVYTITVLDLPSPEACLVVHVIVELPDATQQPIFLRKVVPGLEYEVENIALIFPQQRVAVSNLNGVGDFGSQVIGGIAARWA
jgi:hypothetical protein